MKSIYIKLISFVTSAVMLFASAPLDLTGNVLEKASAVSTDDEQSRVIIRVHYLLENGKKVFNDYSVAIARGESYSSEIPSPTFSGYEPYILKDGEYVSAKTITLDYTNLQENQDINIIYRTAHSPYTVRYFLQNINNDGYTERADMTLRGTALTGEYPKDNIEKSIEGFTPLFHEPDAVAADGNTEFRIYYDRNYYQYSFDCDGGYGVNPVYERYGTNLVVPAPTKHGYTFVGWDKKVDGVYDGKADELPETVGAENAEYKALWKAGTTTVRVVYWLENADPDKDGNYDYSYLAEGDPAERESGIKLDINRIEDEGLHKLPDTVNGSHYEYDHETTADVIKHTPVVEGDGSTIINIYYKRKEYTLKFYYAKSNEEKTKYYVMGGSTYGFAESGNYPDNAADKDEYLLESANSYNTAKWGEVKELPQYDSEHYKNYSLGEETYNGYTYYYISFKARYGSDIEHDWPFGTLDDPVFKSVDIVGTHSQWSGTKAIFSAWTPEHHIKYARDQYASGIGNYTIKGDYHRLDDSILYDPVYDDSDEVCFLAFWENGAEVNWSVPKLFVYNIYAEVLAGEEETAGNTYVSHTYNGVEKRYKLVKTYGVCDDSDKDDGVISNADIAGQTATSMLGFTYIDKEIGETPQFDSSIYKAGYTANFYYTRNSYDFKRIRYDGTTYSDFLLQYETPIKQYLEPPDPPKNLDIKAYDFDNWYRSPVRAEAVSDDTVMSASPMAIYAKWKLKKHKVTFSTNLEDMRNKKYIGDVNGIEIEHNNEINTQDIPHAEWNGYDFKGWFYLNEKGEIQAFDPHTMPVLESMQLFGQWQSPEVAEYTVHYVCDGQPVAADTQGYTFVSNTKTFEAKAGDDLDPDYREGYFPKVNSSSIVIKPSGNEMTLEYEHKGNVNYTVKYVDSSNGNDLVDPVTKNTSFSVVTEEFKYIDGYVADDFSKRLVLTTDDSSNVITFYYVKTEDKKVNYAIKHFTENFDGTYTEYLEEDLIGIKDETVTAKPLSITGFVYDKETTKTENGTKNVTDDGVSCTLSVPTETDNNNIIIKIYYKRQTSNCTIHFVEYGKQDHVLKDPVKLEDGKYEETREYTPDASITAEDGIKYTLVGSQTRNITFKAVDTDIYIYYQSKTILINYQAVCRFPDMTGGTVSPMSELVTSGVNAKGSVPVPYSGFSFAGWYKDISCTQPVSADWVKNDTHRLIPNPADSTTYYALFEPSTASLTISVNGAESTDQSFLFEVKGTNSSLNVTVSVTGNGSVTVNDLPLDDYTVTQITEWSWKYDVSGNRIQQVTLTEDNCEVTFNNAKNEKKWLGGESQKDNPFDKLSG